MHEILIIAGLISLNGLLAMGEIAFVSSRRYKLVAKAREGHKPSTKALALLDDPERLLSAIQIGISLAAILAGAFGGYALAGRLSPLVGRLSLLRPYADEIAFVTVVVAITYLSLVLGELVPKSIALRNPERIATLMTPLLRGITRVFAPAVWLLSVSTKSVLTMTGTAGRRDPPVTEKELKVLLESGRRAGTFGKEEIEIIENVFRFNDKKAGEIMIPRNEIQWIDAEAPNEEVFRHVASHTYSRYIVCRRDIDHFLGFLESKEFLTRYHLEPSFDLRDIVREALVVPETIGSIALLERFRVKKVQVALLVGEHGGTRGLVTLHDIIENVLGELPERDEPAERRIVRRPDGAYEIDAAAEVGDVGEALAFDIRPAGYATLGGLILKLLGRIPEAGESVEYGGWRFDVLDMDGPRVARVLARKVPGRGQAD